MTVNTAGHSRTSSRMIDQRERRLHAGQSFDHCCRGIVVERAARHHRSGQDAHDQPVEHGPQGAGIGAPHVAIAQRTRRAARACRSPEPRQDRERPAPRPERRRAARRRADRPVAPSRVRRRGRRARSTAAARSSRRCVAAAWSVVPWAESSMIRIVSSGSHNSRHVSRNVPLLPRPSSTVPHGTPRARRRCSRHRSARPFGARTSSSTSRRWLRLQSHSSLLAARSRANGTCGASSGTSPMASPTISSRWINVMPLAPPSPCRRRRAPRPAPAVDGCATPPTPSASACRGYQVVRRRRHAAIAQQPCRADEPSGRHRGSPGWLEHVCIPTRAARHPRRTR